MCTEILFFKILQQQRFLSRYHHALCIVLSVVESYDLSVVASCLESEMRLVPFLFLLINTECYNCRYRRKYALML